MRLTRRSTHRLLLALVFMLGATYSCVTEHDERAVPVTHGQDLLDPCGQGLDQSAERDLPSGGPSGLWSATEAPPGNAGLTPTQQREIERLQSLGYVGGVVAGPAGRGVVTHERGAASVGLNLYNSGHGPEAFLMDMDGTVLHRWYRTYEAVFGERAPSDARLVANGVAMNSFWRRVHLYPNGDLLAIFEGLGIVKLDRCSQVLWAAHNGAHHEAAVAENGDIYVLTREAHIVPAVNPDTPILEDFITVLSSDGKTLDHVSVLEAIRSSEFASVLEGSPLRGDIMHTNTLKLLEQLDTPSVFKDGNVLTSFRKQDAIAVIDLSLGKATWALRGATTRQHDPSLLDNGHVLVFDNRAQTSGGSRVIELDPETGRTVWRFPTDGDGLYSDCCGTAQRLGNGNTLITYTEPGRALEVTRDGRIVWQFDSPHRAGVDETLVAQLMEVRRLPEDFADDWLR